MTPAGSPRSLLGGVVTPSGEGDMSAFRDKEERRLLTDGAQSSTSGGLGAERPQEERLHPTTLSHASQMGTVSGWPGSCRTHEAPGATSSAVVVAASAAWFPAASSSLSPASVFLTVPAPSRSLAFAS